MVAGAHELEQFWLFAISGEEGQERARRRCGVGDNLTGEDLVE